MGEDEQKYPTWKWVLMLAIAIIAFLAVRGVDSISARISNQETITAKMQSDTSAACTRLTVLEENYKALREDNGEIKQGLKDVVTALGAHEKATMAAIRKSRGPTE